MSLLQRDIGDKINLKTNVLSKSNQFNYYKDKYQKVADENESLKEYINSLKKENARLEKKISRLESKNDKLDNNFNDLKTFVINEMIGCGPSGLNYCPICGRPNEFLPHGIRQRPNSRCPYCNSLERHRFVYLVFLKKLQHIFSRDNIKLLHFAPESVMYNLFNSNENIEYCPVDFAPEKYDYIENIYPKSVNMENIPFEDDTFDMVYNSHVLEHVADDEKAMRELYRVVKRDGICIVMVPMSKNYETLEKEEYNTPELRLKYYYQKDHLRLYGFDIKEKLESVGFEVEMVTSSDLIPNDDNRKLLGIKKNKVFICKK